MPNPCLPCRVAPAITQVEGCFVRANVQDLLAPRSCPSTSRLSKRFTTAASRDWVCLGAGASRYWSRRVSRKVGEYRLQSSSVQVSEVLRKLREGRLLLCPLLSPVRKECNRLRLDDHVPLESANNRTLGTFFNPRM
ncbi:hypothetical protein HAX54_050113 [Datura stramonium]|uniref:Uncharacterized protein n=1 Tax=Datura stramonium TaxID=4076 RepID=A0ABS8SWR8_DATST|nr:hypothetical protein [Datura stramonium]